MSNAAAASTSGAVFNSAAYNPRGGAQGNTYTPLNGARAGGVPDSAKRAHVENAAQAKINDLVSSATAHAIDSYMCMLSTSNRSIHRCRSTSTAAAQQ